MVAKIIGDVNKTRLIEEIQHENDVHLKLSSLKCDHVLEAYGRSLRERSTGPHLGYIYLQYAPFSDFVDLLNTLGRNPE